MKLNRTAKSQDNFEKYMSGKPLSARPSQNLCKPPIWCKIGALYWRLIIWQEEIGTLKKMPVGQ